MAGAEFLVSPPKSSSRARLVAVVLTGAYCWALTVLPTLVASGPLSMAGVAAGIALISLLASPFLPPGRIALTFALDVFVGFCILSWWSGKDAFAPPPFAIFGSFGWLAYTFALGSLSTPRDREPQADPGPHLEPRVPPSRLSAAAFLLILVGCLVVLGAAWRIERPAMSVFGHVYALAIVLILLRAAALLSTYLQVRGTKLEKPARLKRVVWPLLALLFVGALGLGWLLVAR